MKTEPLAVDYQIVYHVVEVDITNSGEMWRVSVIFEDK